MWFKTRHGLFSVIEPFEIRVSKYPKDKKPSYQIWARSLNDSEVVYKGILGNLKAPGKYIHLAEFHLVESSEAEIAQCMTLIESAIVNEARLVDLSAVGHADAWAEGWNLIKW